MRELFRVTTLFLLGGAVSAQTTPELIGVTAATPLLRTRGMGLCEERFCAPSLFPPMASHPAAGGTAYDPTRGGAWISNGTHIALVAEDACRYLCAPVPLPLPRAFVSGLAVNEIRGRLIVSDTASMIHVYALECPLRAPVLSCAAAVPATHTIGGVATADVEEYVIFSSSDFSGTAPPGNILYVAPIGRPCATFCRIPIPRCNGRDLGPIHGVAYDQCTSTVWVTDGFATLGMTLDVTSCRLTPSHCCPAAGSEPFIGLCVLPSRATLIGRTCVRPRCPACGTATIGTIGHPAIGNGAFAATLSGAPAGAAAALLLSLGGPCRLPGAVPPPPFCGALHVTFAGMLVLGPVSTAGTVGCTGSATMPIPVPAGLELCGLHACAQWIGVCLPDGTFTSNAMSFALSGT